MQLRRLHPTSLVFHLLHVAWSLLVPILIAVFLARNETETWVAALALPAAVLAVARYLAYGYRLDERELVVRQGLLTRQERHIPYDRIQNIHLVEGPLHRSWRVAEVRIETAAGKEPEASLRVLSLDVVAELRARVDAARARPAAAAAPAPAAAAATAAAGVAPAAGPLVALTARDLILAGLTRGRGALVVAGAVGLAVQLDLVQWESVPATVRGLLEEWRYATLDADRLTLVALVGAALLGLVLLMRVLSVAWSLVKFHRFTLERQDDDLRTAYGLVSRISTAIPRHRIQRLFAESRPLHRVFDRVQVRVETAGGTEGASSGEAAHLWLAPLLDEARLAELVAAALPEVALAEVAWQPLGAAARRRRLARAAGVATLVAAASALAVGAGALLVLALGLLLGAADAALYVRRAQWALTPSAFLCRTGWWVRRMSIVSCAKIQVVALRQSPLDLGFGLAAVEVDTAGAGRVGHRVRIPYLPAAAAAELAGHLAAAASATAYEW